MCAALIEWNAHKEHRLAGATFELDKSAVTADQLLGGRQAKAGPFGPAGHQRVEDRILQLDGYARTIILDFYRCNHPVAHVADSEVGYGSAAQRDRSLPIQRGRGVSHKIEE